MTDKTNCLEGSTPAEMREKTTEALLDVIANDAAWTPWACALPALAELVRRGAQPVNTITVGEVSVARPADVAALRDWAFHAVQLLGELQADIKIAIRLSDDHRHALTSLLEAADAQGWGEPK